MDRLLQGFFERTYIDIFGMVEEMRRNRSHMVQTEVRKNKSDFVIKRGLLASSRAGESHQIIYLFVEPVRTYLSDGGRHPLRQVSA